jgi:hypothetical protein
MAGTASHSQPIGPRLREPEKRGFWLRVTRLWLPLALVVGGIVLMVLGHGHYTSFVANRDSLLSGLGMCLELIALSVALLNWFVRLTMQSDKDRDREDWARDYFTRTGRWPGDSVRSGDEDQG